MGRGAVALKAGRKWGMRDNGALYVNWALAMDYARKRTDTARTSYGITRMEQHKKEYDFWDGVEGFLRQVEAFALKQGA